MKLCATCTCRMPKRQEEAIGCPGEGNTESRDLPSVYLGIDHWSFTAEVSTQARWCDRHL